MLALGSMDREFELLRAWRSGDERAGNALFELYFDAVHRFFYGKIEDALVEELAQETFLSIVRNRDSLDGHSSVRAYLYTVARNKLYDRLRRRGRTPVPAELVERSLPDPSATPTVELAQRQQQRLLLQALRSLPVEQQILVELRYFEGLRGPELAEALEIPEGTVRSRLRRSHQLLREQVELLAESPEQLHSTLSDLEDWAEVVRERIAGP